MKLSVLELYCIVKTQRAEKSLQPTVSALGSLTYNLAKWLIKVYENLSNVKSSVGKFRKYFTFLSKEKVHFNVYQVSL